MKNATTKNLTTILFLVILSSLLAASSLPTGSIRADGVRPNDATAVSPVLDEARAVKQVISTEGGQLTASAADGTRFTLVVPAKALLSDLEITMTPVAQVGQLPLSGGLVAAVQLEPEGLVLWQPASLTIEPAVPVPVTEQLSFAWHKEGEGFHTYPLQIDPSTITMDLVHFSGYGVGRGTDAEGDASAPANEQDQLESDTEKQNRMERKFRHQNPDLNKKKLKKRNRQLCAAFNLEVLRFFDNLKRQFDPALASRDEAKLRCLLSAALKWERFATIEQAFLGCVPESVTAAFEILANFRLKALEILADKAYERCGSEHGAGEAIRLWSLEKQARQYAAGYADGVTEVLFIKLADRIKEKAKKCARFELQFESVINGLVVADGENVYSFEGHVRATVPIQFEPEKTPLAEAPLEYLSFSINPCTVVGLQGSTFQVIDITFDLNLRDDGCAGGSEAAATLVSMTISDGTPTENILCDKDIRWPTVDLWSGNFTLLHLTEWDEANNYVISGWSKGQNELFARKTYQQTKETVLVPGAVERYSETTTFDLFHRPE